LIAEAVQTVVEKISQYITDHLSDSQTLKDTLTKTAELKEKLTEISSKTDHLATKEQLQTTIDKLQSIKETAGLQLSKQTEIANNTDIANTKLDTLKNNQDTQISQNTDISTKLDKLEKLNKLDKLDKLDDIDTTSIKNSVDSLKQSNERDFFNIDDTLKIIKNSIDNVCSQFGLCDSDLPIPTPPDIQSVDIGTLDTTSKATSSGYCPADITYTIHSGTTLTFTYSYICQFASQIRFILITLAYLIGIRILSSSKT
jgi:hypothetical protein